MRLDPDGQRPLGRPKNQWMDRIKEDMKCIGAWGPDPAHRGLRSGLRGCPGNSEGLAHGAFASENATCPSEVKHKP
ncbi:hypothetical protein L345_03545, partial [Ophiophagus hannah]